MKKSLATEQPITPEPAARVDYQDVLLCTVCDDRFLPGALVMLSSLRRNLPGFSSYALTILHQSAISALSEPSKQAILEIAPQANFESTEQSVYRRSELKDEHHRQAYSALEVFRLTGHRVLCYFDIDMLCLRDFSRLFSISSPVAACVHNAGGRWLDFEGVAAWPRHFLINSGFFLLDESQRSDEAYTEVLERCASRRKIKDMLDQPMLNAHLKGRNLPLYFLPERFNFRRWGGIDSEASNWDGWGSNEALQANLGNISLIHYSNYKFRRKPWETDPATPWLAYSLWHQEKQALLKQHPGLRRFFE